MKFNFGSQDGATPSAYVKSTTEAMIAAANGKPLPGRLGLVQSLCNVWTAGTPDQKAGRIQKVLWATKSSLSTVGVWQAYKESLKSAAQAPRDAFFVFCEEQGIQKSSPLRTIAELVLHASQDIPYEDLTLKDDKCHIIRKFTPKDAPDCAYYFKIYRSSESATTWPSEGPLFRLGFENKAINIVRGLIWNQFKSHNIRLTVAEAAPSMFEGPSGSPMELSDAGGTDPYVSDENAEEWTNADVYAKRCHAFMSRGLIRGVLFYGPPGTGKTSLAMNVLGNAGRTLKITSTAIARADFSNIARLIDVLDPRVILFDDIDRFGHGDLHAMLEYMEGLKKSPPPEGRIIVGTVNAIDTLDPALLRAGRFDEVLAVPEPGPGKRLAIVQHYLRFFSHAVSGLNAQELSDKMDGFSPADIRGVLESISCVGADYLDAEIARTRMQRGLFSGDRVSKYLSDRNNPSVDDGKVIGKSGYASP